MYEIMLEKLKENTLERIKELEPKTILLCIALFLVSSLVMGTLLRFICIPGKGGSAFVEFIYRLAHCVVRFN